ncbi:hypothetical protein [Paraburkholderia azotifigens]|uniref:Uncharacterized protein n=1 Tax=Paraburkholderia azotifigens TaxID=2057004 RepID=A0A5C6V7C9_9BURK|nr:hypothetical protein [Paraburkholderia azotifigens]TXC80949.1 hypothetical protein FRZ40_42870 [Paraburkholderia azotifigens]
MSVSASSSTQSPAPQAGSPQSGANAGSAHASTTIRVVDPNQQPDENGKTPNVATEFHITPDGKVIQTGSQVVPRPPHDPNNDEGKGSVFWRGLKDGFANPFGFLFWAFGQRKAALEDRENTPAEEEANRAKGEPYDNAADQVPFVYTAKQIGRAISGLIDAMLGKQPDPIDTSPPATVEGGGEHKGKKPTTVVTVNPNSANHG